MIVRQHCLFYVSVDMHLFFLYLRTEREGEREEREGDMEGRKGREEREERERRPYVL